MVRYIRNDETDVRMEQMPVIQGPDGQPIWIDKEEIGIPSEVIIPLVISSKTWLNSFKTGLKSEQEDRKTYFEMWQSVVDKYGIPETGMAMKEHENASEVLRVL